MKAPLPEITAETIRRVTARIIRACRPEAIYLFGSAAREAARPGSDLDLLVVADLDPDETARQKASELDALFYGWLVPLDLIVRTGCTGGPAALPARASKDRQLEDR